MKEGLILQVASMQASRNFRVSVVILLYRPMEIRKQAATTYKYCTHC